MAMIWSWFSPFKKVSHDFAIFSSLSLFELNRRQDRDSVQFYTINHALANCPAKNATPVYHFSNYCVLSVSDNAQMVIF